MDFNSYTDKLKDSRKLILSKTDKGFGIYAMTDVRYDEIYLSDEDLSSLANDIKEYLTNKLLEIED